MLLDKEQLIDLLEESPKKCFFSMMVMVEKKYGVEHVLENIKGIRQLTDFYIDQVDNYKKTWDIFKKEWLKNGKEW